MGGLKVFSSPSAVIERVGSACGLSEFLIARCIYSNEKKGRNKLKY